MKKESFLQRNEDVILYITTSVSSVVLVYYAVWLGYVIPYENPKMTYWEVKLYAFNHFGELWPMWLSMIVCIICYFRLKRYGKS